MPPELTVVVPTLNERANVRPMVDALTAVLHAMDWEVVFVDDDSTDQTADEVRSLAAANPRVRVIHRVGRRGLSSACVEGLMSSSAPYLAVLDADMQHDEQLLPDMLETLIGDDVELVIASRYMAGGGTGEWAQSRQRISRIAGRFSHALLRTRLTDPMSGMFMLRAELLHRVVHKLSGRGFKILLDIISSADEPPAYRELPYTMRRRQRGQSKLDTLVIWEYLLLLLDKSIGRYLPVRFMMFASVGLLGALFHLGVLGVMLFGLGSTFDQGQFAATLVAMTSNFFFNNLFTYRDMRQRGWRLVRGLVVFYLACSIGAFINIQVAGALFAMGAPWWGAGVLGAMISAVWNFSVTSTTIWNRKSDRPRRAATAEARPLEERAR